MLKYWKRILWTVCVLFLCVIDQRIGSSTGEPQLIFSACVALVVGIFILTHYSIRDFLKLPYAVWALLCLIGVPAAMIWGRGHTLYPGRFNTVICILALYGFILIRTFIAFMIEKKKPGIAPAGLTLFGILFLFIAFSRYNDKWPLMYLAAFFLFYLTDLTQEEKETFLCALQDGIIAGFFLIQGLALVFRPYDTLRYMGMYANTNMNALFYQAVYCAFLSRFCILEAHKYAEGVSPIPLLEKIWKWACLAFAAAMWPFVFLTMCRSALLGMGAATVLAGIYCIKYCAKKRFLHGAGYAALLALIAVAGFPVVYGAVRYLPPLFHHPIWFYNDYSEERVHSSDPWDSPKFTGWEEVLKENLGRFADLLPMSLEGNGGYSAQTDPEGLDYSDIADPADLPGNSDSATAAGLPGNSNSATATGLPDYSDSTAPASLPDYSDSTAPASLPDYSDSTAPAALPDSFDATSPSDLPGGLDASDPDAANPLPEDAVPELKSTSARLSIYSHYLANLNLTGHLEQENGLQVSEDYYAPHAHNLFLQYAFNYGIPAGILFFLWIVVTGIRLLINVFRGQKPSPCIAALLLFAASIVFGLTEIMWRNGLLSNTMMFLLPYFAWAQKGSEAKDPS